ncbi:MAG: KH domain-containing protein [Candidatus Aenigmarchaeota archaeon]|nr:KH domain-containing protein [Candidatus Aenigmarchaeota archaeon]MDW8149605.1 KH domain-containing protein [Candidatus Aenigmarchaeota archaeon]
MILNINIPKNRLKIANDCINEILSYLKDIKIQHSFNSFLIEGENILNVYKAYNILLAIARGFKKEDAMLLLKDEYKIDIIPIEAYVKSRNRQIALKGRVIGEGGKTKNWIEKRTNTKISIYGKTIGIIGSSMNVEIAKEVIEMLLKGSKHSTAYKNLEQRIKSLIP